jgi:ribose transport system substrate-binding protein
MTALDRDRHPAGFAVVTSVISGLCVALMIAAVKAGFVIGGTVPAWSLVAVCGVALILCGLVWIRPWRRTARRSFLLIPAFSQKHWVAELIQNTHRALDRHGVDVVLKIPDRDYVADCQVHHMRRIVTRRSDYTGGFIVPVELDRIRSDLLRFCREIRQPVVLMDVEPFNDEEAYPDNTAFVGYSGRDRRGCGKLGHQLSCGRSRSQSHRTGDRQ